MTAVQGSVLQISPSQIEKNPENPRLVFRQAEMEALLVSINDIGIQVPLTVYKDGNKYVLVDGERRWRCAAKLNLPTVPILVQQKPSELQNLVLMYNIHALREQWDYLTIASKLKRMEDLISKEVGRRPSERELSNRTGLTVGQIRRCRLLMSLPEEDRARLSDELEKPKSEQVFSEDFFIELQKSLSALQNRLPTFKDDVEDIRNVLIDKYEKKVIGAVTDFRLLSKMTNAAQRGEIPKAQVVRAVRKIANEKNKVGIKEVFEEQFQESISESAATRRIRSITAFLLSRIQSGSLNFAPDTKQALRELARALSKCKFGS